MSKILIGSDHAGFDLKMVLKEYMEKKGMEVLDVGCAESVACDYPDFARRLCKRIQQGDASRGVLICGTGIGMSIAAKRFRGIRAALCTTEFHAKMSRAHNDSNVLVLGSRITCAAPALEILRVWLETPFEQGRHLRRIDLIDCEGKS